MYIRSEIHFLYHTKSTYPGDYPVSVYVPILQMIMEMSNISSTHLRQKQVSTVDDIYIPLHKAEKSQSTVKIPKSVRKWKRPIFCIRVCTRTSTCRVDLWL